MQQCTHKRRFSPAFWLVRGEADTCLSVGSAVPIVFCTHKKKNSEMYITFLNCHHNLGIIAFRHYLWQKLNSLSSMLDKT